MWCFDTKKAKTASKFEVRNKRTNKLVSTFGSYKEATDYACPFTEKIVEVQG